MYRISKRDKDLIENFEEMYSKYSKYLKNTKAGIYTKLGEVNYQESNAIKYLGKNGEKTMHEIAENNLLAMSTMTGIVDKMVNKGWVWREHSEKDRRSVLVGLTESGKEVYDLYLAYHSEFVNAMLRALDEEDQNMYLQLLKKMVANIQFGSDKAKK